jgi:hypothetical protein
LPDFTDAGRAFHSWPIAHRHRKGFDEPKYSADKHWPDFPAATLFIS